MKKFTPIFFALSVCTLFNFNILQAQTIVLSEYFTTYDGTALTAPAGWEFSYNGNYTSPFGTGSSGPSGPNCYKFGENNATITSPAFTSADSLKFYIKGNGTGTASALAIFQGPDTSNFTSLDVINPIPTTNGFFAYQILPATQYVRFVYTKVLGNVAFDDFEVTKNSPTSINTVDKKQVLVYPNPAKNMVNIETNSSEITDIKVYNMIGNVVDNIAISDNSKGLFSLNLNTVPAGTYFIRIKNSTGVITRRLQVTK